MRQQLEDTQHHAARYKSEREAGRAEIDFLRKEVSPARLVTMHRTCQPTYPPQQLSTAAGREKAITDENQQLKDLLDTRRQELKDAQRFMGTVDVSAESDVVEAVHGLNTEIFDLARSLAERATPTEHDQNARRSAETALAGEGLLDPFFSLFRSAKARDEATLEIAMQLVTTRYLAKFISTWTGYAETDTAFTTLYDRIQRSGKTFERTVLPLTERVLFSEKQSVAGQWRALTRRFAAGEASSAQMGAHCESVLPVLLRHAATLSGMRPTANCKLEPLIHIMVSKALKIRRLIGEAMISSNYEVVVPLPETLFNAREMEDVYAPRGNKGRRSGLHVTCCVALGLRRVEKVEGQLRSEMLVKSEVGLQTLLADLGLETASTWSGAPAVR